MSKLFTALFACAAHGNVSPMDRDHIREYGLFAQDTWRIHPARTLTLGFRYEKQFPFVNDSGLYSQVDIAGIWGLSGINNLFRPGVQTGVAPTYNKLDANNNYKIPAIFAPSIGAAWQMPGMEGPLGWIFGK